MLCQNPAFSFSRATPRDVEYSLQRRLSEYSLPTMLSAVNGDKWLLSSTVQKLIRRGLVGPAVAAALSLHRIDPHYLARRLPIIAVEDVGIADLRACVDVLTLCSSATWWREDAAQTIGFAVTQLAEAVKCRAACDAMCLGEAVASLEDRQGAMVQASRAELVDVAADRSALLTSRINALRALGGISVREGRYYRTVRPCDVLALVEVADRLEMPPLVRWAAAGLMDTWLRWKIEPEVVYGNKTAFQPGVQGRGSQAGDRTGRVNRAGCS